MTYGYTYRLPVFEPVGSSPFPSYDSTYSADPLPSYCSDYSNQANDALPMPMVKAAMTPCCREVYDSQRLLNHVQSFQTCPKDKKHTLFERDLLPVNDLSNVSLKTIHREPQPANQAPRINHVAKERFSIFAALWTGVKAVIKFAAQLAVAAFSILFEIVKLLLKLVAFTALFGGIVVFAANPTVVTGVALLGLALLAHSMSRL